MSPLASKLPEHFSDEIDPAEFLSLTGLAPEELFLLDGYAPNVSRAARKCARLRRLKSSSVMHARVLGFDAHASAATIDSLVTKNGAPASAIEAKQRQLFRIMKGVTYLGGTVSYESSTGSHDWSREAQFMELKQDLSLLCTSISKAVFAPTCKPVTVADSERSVVEESQIGDFSTDWFGASKELGQYIGEFPGVVSVFGYGSAWAIRNHNGNTVRHADWDVGTIVQDDVFENMSALADVYEGLVKQGFKHPYDGLPIGINILPQSGAKYFGLHSHNPLAFSQQQRVLYGTMDFPISVGVSDSAEQGMITVARNLKVINSFYMHVKRLPTQTKPTVIPRGFSNGYSLLEVVSTQEGLFHYIQKIPFRIAEVLHRTQAIFAHRENHGDFSSLPLETVLSQSKQDVYAFVKEQTGYETVTLDGNHGDVEFAFDRIVAARDATRKLICDLHLYWSQLITT